MEYTIEYEEIIRRINSVTVEVGSLNEGEKIAAALSEKANGFQHPDDILCTLGNMGVEILDVCKGAEDCEYEIQ